MPTTPATNRRRSQRSSLAVVAVVAVVASGCGGPEPAFEIDDLSRLPVREELVEIDLGSFIIPVPVVLESAIDRFEPDNLMQVEFDLVAIVEPGQVSTVERSLERNNGRVRDRVIRVCRSTGREDLVEAEWSTLKAKLLDATLPLLGGKGIRRLVVPRIVKDEL